VFIESYYIQYVNGSKNNNNLLIKESIVLKELKKILIIKIYKMIIKLVNMIEKRYVYTFWKYVNNVPTF